METARQGDVLVVRLERSLSGAEVRTIRDGVRGALGGDGRPRIVAFDLWECPAIDTLGLHLLGELAREVSVLLFGATGLLAAQLQLMDIPEGVRVVGHAAAIELLRMHRHVDRPERRRDPRVNIVLPAVVEWEDGAAGTIQSFARTRDVSERGLGIAVASILPGLVLPSAPDGPVAIGVRVPALFGSEWAQGRVVPHARERAIGTFGVVLHDPGETTRDRIRQFVRTVAGA